MALDGIVTLVDAKHIWQHIDDSDEAKERSGFRGCDPDSTNSIWCPPAKWTGSKPGSAP